MSVNDNVSHHAHSLVAALLDTIQLAQQRGTQIHELQETLHAALDLLHRQRLELDRVRARYHGLLEQRRAERTRVAA
jgi:hypothetical protein